MRPQRNPRTRGSAPRVVKAPAAVGRVIQSRPGDRMPSISNRGNVMRVTHNERLGAITTSGVGLEVRKFSVNPGLAGSFPWLCDVANRFDKYKFRKISFKYLPNSPTLAGTITMCADYDANDDAPASTDQAATYEDYVTTSIWQPATLNLNLAQNDMLPQKDTRPGLPGADIDLNMYDVGNLFVLTEGAAAAIIGFVEVTYTVDLFGHQIQAGIGGLELCFTDQDATHLFGSAATVDKEAFLPGTSTSTAVFTFNQPFQGMICAVIKGTGLGTDFAPVISATGATAHVNCKTNAGFTETIAFFAVQAKAGTTLTPTITATTVVETDWWFAKAWYPACVYP